MAVDVKIVLRVLKIVVEILEHFFGKESENPPC